MPAMPASRAAPTRVRQGEAMDTREPAWPALLVADWEDTRDTLHLWTQMVGKLRLALTPRVNHWWNVPLYVMGVLFVIGAACWVIVDPERPVFDEGLAPAASAPPLYTPPRRHRR